MKAIIPILFAILLVACGGAPETPSGEGESDSMNVDMTGDGDKDVVVEMDDDAAKVTIEMDDVMDDEAKEAIANVPEEFCVPGTTFTYEDEQSSTDSEVIGLSTYKGKTWCKAESTTMIESPVGVITAETVYYFDRTFREYWVVTTTSGPVPAQTTEVHIVDGEVQ